MPIYEYRARDADQSCGKCRDAFEQLQSLREPPLAVCPACGAPVARQISAPAIGGSRSNFDDRAKRAGFHKLQKLGKGEYEKKY